MSKPSTTTGAVSNVDCREPTEPIENLGDVEVRRSHSTNGHDTVELRITSAVSLTISLDPGAAADLADAINTATAAERVVDEPSSE